MRALASIIAANRSLKVIEVNALPSMPGDMPAFVEGVEAIAVNPVLEELVINGETIPIALFRDVPRTLTAPPSSLATTSTTTTTTVTTGSTALATTALIDEKKDVNKIVVSTPANIQITAKNGGFCIPIIGQLLKV